MLCRETVSDGGMPPVPSRWSAPGRQQVGEYLGQAVERLEIPHQPFADRLLVTAQPIPKPTATTLEKLLVQGGQRDRPRHRHQ